MNPVVKERWIAALRSGMYKQGTKKLRDLKPGDDDYSFCCLGVLTQICAADRNTQFEKLCVYGREILSPEVVDWARLDSGNPILRGRFGRNFGDSLAEMNDSGKTFAEIADEIEARL